MKSTFALAGLAIAGAGIAAAIPASAQDLACFGTLSRGLVCLNDGKYEPHSQQASRLPSNSVNSLISCGNRIVATMAGAVLVYDGKVWSAPNRPPGGFASRVACAGAGKYWVAMTGGVGYWDGTGWKIYAAKDIAGDAGTTVVFDVAAGPDGSAWVAMANGIALRFQGGNWTVFKEGQGFDKRYPFTRIHADAKGNAWIPTGGAVLAFRDGKWQTVPGVASFTAVAFGGDGKIWYSSGSKLHVIDGDKRAEYDLGWSMRGIAVDANGFVWAAGEFGVARFADGKFEQRHMHNSALPENDFSTVAVTGKASLLPPMAEQPAGSLTGRLEWSDGKVVAGAEMQVCAVTAALFSGPDGPCAQRPLFLKAVTDAEGKFNFPKAPPAAYRMAVKPVGAKRWIVFLGTSDRLRVGAGEAKNGGTLSLDIRNREQN